MLQAVTFWRHIPSKIPKMIWREKEKGHMGTIFGPLLTHFGQIMTEANVEMLILKMPMLNHDTPERNLFYFIQKCYVIQELFLNLSRVFFSIL